MGYVWDLIILKPVLNVLVVLASYLFSNFGLTIIVFTIITRAMMYPLTLKQTKATKAMQTMQPKLLELQKKYAKDKQRLAQEQMRLYKESGVSPAGCLIPMLVQMPVWIALYQAIIRVIAVSPEDFLGLSRFLYSWPVVFSMVPLSNKFLWFDLATGDTILALLVGASMWVQQKMVTPVSTDPRQAQQSRMMLWMMPMMFTVLSLQFPAGLALYWVVSNIITIGIQYFVTGWGTLVPSGFRLWGRTPGEKVQKRVAEIEAPPTQESEQPEAPEAAPQEPPKPTYPGQMKSIRQRTKKKKD